jgi:hypothetical protein
MMIPMKLWDAFPFLMLFLLAIAVWWTTDVGFRWKFFQEWKSEEEIEPGESRRRIHHQGRRG